MVCNGWPGCRPGSDARRAAWLAEAERTDAAQREGFRSTTEWLMALSGEPAPTCRSQVAVAEALAGDAGHTGSVRFRGAVREQGEEPWPRRKPWRRSSSPEQEQTLVAEVTAAPSPQRPRGADTRGNAPWTLDAAEAEAERLHQMRALHLSKNWTGMVHVSGDLDPAGGLVVLKALRLCPIPPTWTPTTLRTPAQARADALVGVCQQYLQGGGKGKKRPAGRAGHHPLEHPRMTAKASSTPKPARSAARP